MGMPNRPLMLLPLLAGCYNYAKVEPGAVTAGMEVRAQITGAASDRIAPLISSFDTRVLTGNVVENKNGELVLEVAKGAMPNVSEAVVPLRQRIPLNPGDFMSLETRRLDVARTSLFAAGVAAGIAAIGIAALKSHGEGTVGDPGPQPPPVNRIPVIRFHF